MKSLGRGRQRGAPAIRLPAYGALKGLRGCWAESWESRPGRADRARQPKRGLLDSRPVPARPQSDASAKKHAPAGLPEGRTWAAGRSPDQASPAAAAERVRRPLIALQALILAGIVLYWVVARQDAALGDLVIIFLYCFPSEFLFALLPHEPALLFFGRLYSPVVVALLSTAGTLCAETLNYYVGMRMASWDAVQAASQGRVLARTIRLFGKYPFLAVWIAAFTPIPFFPFRFLVVLSRYSLARYLLAVATARGPRFYLLAYFGAVVPVPDAALIALFVAIFAGSLWVSRLRGRPQPSRVPAAGEPRSVATGTGAEEPAAY